jgi:hypothetical protein
MGSSCRWNGVKWPFREPAGAEIVVDERIEGVAIVVARFMTDGTVDVGQGGKDPPRQLKQPLSVLAAQRTERDCLEPAGSQSRRDWVRRRSASRDRRPLHD